MSDHRQPPHSDEIEVSLLGPGYGECIVAHVGTGEWLIIDSCIDKSGQPAALEYLKSIGVDASNVKFVLATHWHDDHIRGLSEVVRQSPSAQFSCSVALRDKEFFRLVAAVGQRSMMATTGVDELSKIFALLKTRKQSGHSRATPQWAVESRPLWRRSAPIEVEVHALSPSDASISLALARLAALVPKAGLPKRRIPALAPNHASVVLWVRVGERRILLGADLEETADAGRGWSAVISCVTRPAGKASVFKIPHHGSPTAEHPQVWTDLLDPDPRSILTPFIKGDVSLPGETDLARLRERTKHAFITTPPNTTTSLRKRPAMVHKMMKEMVRSIKPVPISTGHVRLRTSAGDISQPWSIELFNGATSIHS